MILMTYNPGWSFQLQLLNIDQGTAKLQQLTILDARPHTQWQQGHLPGAYSFSWEDYTNSDSSGVKYRILPPQQLAKTLGSMGISNDSTILIYADADTSWGGEGWLAWMFAWLGHQGPVYILDGGIQAWTAAKLALNTAQPSAEETTYEFTLQPQVTISASKLTQHNTQYTVIDTRNYWTEWLPGHLPNAINIDWKKFYRGADHRPLSGTELTAMLKANGVDLDKPVVYYCSGGIRSGYTWMVHMLAGLPTAINFEGGIEEWNQRQ
jgi:thiosulfate/3-mercaptopyruvate sulfurtransferase